MIRDIGKNKFIFYLGFSAFLFLVFGFKDILILTSKVWPHLYALVGAPKAVWEETYCYLPFANNFGWDNLLPAAPMLNHGLSKLTFFPPITLLAQGILFKWVFLSNIDTYLLFMHTLFPIASFWVIFLIFRRYINIPWAMMLAFFGVNCYPDFSLIPYFINLITHPGLAIATASLAPLEISKAPMPSFSLFVFALTFYITLRFKKPSNTFYLLISTLWALNIYVYPLNFMAGIIFWFLYIIYTRYIRDGRINFRNTIRSLLKNLAVVIVVISPVIIKRLLFFSPLDDEIFQKMGLVGRDIGFVANRWGWEFSYFLPLIMVVIIIWIYCADYYELLYRFAPVFAMIIVEILASNMHLLLGKFLQPGLFSRRIGNFFPRYLYYIPIIYFISIPYKKLFHEDFKNRLSQATHLFFNRVFIVHRYLIAGLGIFLTAFFTICSGLRFVKNHEDVTAFRMVQVKESFDELISAASLDDSVVVSEDIPVNLMIPVLSRRGTLLVSAASNYASSEEMLSRLVLFGHIFDWNTQEFLDFMMPCEEYNDFYSRNDFIVSDKILRRGFGYWLVNLCRSMSAEELCTYREKLIKMYQGFDLNKAMIKYDVSIVQTAGKINQQLSVTKVIRGKNLTLYLLGKTL